jgi:hypothetical protein
MKNILLKWQIPVYNFLRKWWLVSKLVENWCGLRTGIAWDRKEEESPQLEAVTRGLVKKHRKT